MHAYCMHNPLAHIYMLIENEKGKELTFNEYLSLGWVFYI